MIFQKKRKCDKLKNERKIKAKKSGKKLKILVSFLNWETQRFIFYSLFVHFTKKKMFYLIKLKKIILSQFFHLFHSSNLYRSFQLKFNFFISSQLYFEKNIQCKNFIEREFNQIIN